MNLLDEVASECETRLDSKTASRTLFSRASAELTDLLEDLSRESQTGGSGVSGQSPDDS